MRSINVDISAMFEMVVARVCGTRMPSTATARDARTSDISAKRSGAAMYPGIQPFGRWP